MTLKPYLHELRLLIGFERNTTSHGEKWTSAFWRFIGLPLGSFTRHHSRLFAEMAAVIRYYGGLYIISYVATSCPRGYLCFSPLVFQSSPQP